MKEGLRLAFFQPLLVYQNRWQIVDPDVVGGGHAFASGGDSAIDQTGDLNAAGLAHYQGSWRLAARLFLPIGDPYFYQVQGLKSWSYQSPKPPLCRELNALYIWISLSVC